MQLSVILGFISNPPSAKRIGTQTACMVVEFLFLGGFQPSSGDRTSEQRSGQSNYDSGKAQNNYDLGKEHNKLHLVAPRQKAISGRYRYDAVPI